MKNTQHHLHLKSYVGDYGFNHNYVDYALVLVAGKPVHVLILQHDIKLWTKSGEIQCWRNGIPLRYNFYQCTQQFKLLDSHQIR